MNIKNIFLGSLIIFSTLSSFSQEANNHYPSSKNQEELSIESINRKIKYINSDITILDMYETVDYLQSSQFSNDLNIKKEAAKAMFEIAKTEKLPEDLRRNSLIGAIAITPPSDDSLKMLIYGSESELIIGDKYYGLLSTHFESGNEELKEEIIDEVLSSKSEYGKHIFLVYNKDSEIIKNLSEKLINKIESHIFKEIPKFTSPKNILNIIDYNAISAWAVMYKNIELAKGNNEAEITVLEYITNENLDPRYATAIVYSSLFDDAIYSKENKEIYLKIHDKIKKAQDTSTTSKTYDIDIFLHGAVEKLKM